MPFLEKIAVTGGGGYCGTRLVPQLLSHGYSVTVLDTFWFDNYLPAKHPKLRIIQGDIRDPDVLKNALIGQDAVIHLACISNDASFELDETLSTSVNLHAFEPMVVASKEFGVKRFIYVSSSSVYGVSDEPNVTEEHPLMPLTLYNKYKGMCEPLLFKHTNENFVGVVFRPATVCGYSPRQRLDLSVNILTNLAINKRKITVFGGTQMRPNLHIQDYCDAITTLLAVESSKIQNQIFNFGSQNLTISDISLIVKRIVEKEFPGPEITIETTSSEDNRSYHINSDKIARILGIVPKLTVEDAIVEICTAFKSGLLPNSLEDDRYFNVKKLKRIQAQ